MGKRGSIRLSGDPQAEAVAHIARLIPSLSKRYEVAYESAAGASNTFAVDGKEFGFPVLRFEMLWPLTDVNDRNAPEPGLPHGRFPYGDKFVSACRAKNVPAGHILDVCTSGAWDPNWPNLDEAFQSESRRLTDVDQACDLKIGEFVLSRFRSERLFWTVDHPCDVLLAELTKEVLSAADLIGGPREVDRAFTPDTTGGLLGVYAVPIHPHIAAHYGLTWYRRDQSYRAFELSYTFETYYQAFVSSAG